MCWFKELRRLPARILNMTMLVFASCMSALDNPEQPVWAEAAAHKPEWLVLGGDNNYMDYGVHLNQSRNWTPARFAQEMQLRYERQFAVPTFRALVETIPAGQVIGVWDDHDFAWQNCFGADPSYGMPEKKRIATAFYHHYFAELNRRPLAAELPPLVIPDLSDPPNGTREVYRALDIGPFRVLLCDGRTWRGRHPPGTKSGDLLGPAQEAWLLDELAGPGPFLLITGSTMTAAHDQAWDYYGDFYQQRFLPAVRDKVVLFVGGDVHENRLAPRLPGHPVEVISSASCLSYVLNKRNFGVIDIRPDQARIFLYTRGEVQLTGILDLASGEFVTSMSVSDTDVQSDPALAREQRSAGLLDLLRRRGV
jgi:alkaline phosphatase D